MYSRQSAGIPACPQSLYGGSVRGTKIQYNQKLKLGIRKRIINDIKQRLTALPSFSNSGQPI